MTKLILCAASRADCFCNDENCAIQRMQLHSVATCRRRTLIIHLIGFKAMRLKPLGSTALKRLTREAKSFDPQAFNNRRPIFLIAGQPGVGRTTLIRNVVERLGDEVPSRKFRGFYTPEIRDGESRVGYEVVTLNGGRGVLAHIDDSKGNPLIPMGKRYKIDVAGFEAVALPELEPRRDTSLYVIDEIGKMELCSPNFFPAVWRLFETKTPVIASLPTPRPRADIVEVDMVANMPATHLHQVTEKNRAETEELVFTLLNWMC